MSAQVSETEPQPQRAVAFLDVLGFSKLVSQNPHEMVVRLYDSLVVQMLQSATTGAPLLVGEGEQRRAQPDFTTANVNILIVSDSIVAYTDATSMVDMVNLLAFTGKALVTGMYMACHFAAP